MGAQIDLTARAVRWLSPLSLWTGILAGPVAWAFDLMASYALVKWACRQQSVFAIYTITALALAVVCSGAVLSWLAFQYTSAISRTDGGHPLERARFMAILGLTTSALFALQILAKAIPPSVLDACQ